MKVMQRFEENLEALGFDMAPVAWDLARVPFPDDESRRKVLIELSGGQNYGGRGPKFD